MRRRREGLLRDLRETFKWLLRNSSQHSRHNGERDVISTRKILVTWRSDGNFSELRRKIASLGEKERHGDICKWNSNQMQEVEMRNIILLPRILGKRPVVTGVFSRKIRICPRAANYATVICKADFNGIGRVRMKNINLLRLSKEHANELWGIASEREKINAHFRFVSFFTNAIWITM